MDQTRIAYGPGLHRPILVDKKVAKIMDGHKPVQVRGLTRPIRISCCTGIQNGLFPVDRIIAPAYVMGKRTIGMPLGQ